MMTVKLFVLLVLCALAALSQAFIVPNGTENGVYLHKPNEDGTHTHTALSIAVKRDTEILGRSAKFRSRDLPLPYTTTKCGNGDNFMYNIKWNDMDAALTEFHKNCIAEIDLGGEGHDLYSVHGEAIVFMCNYGGRWCKPDEFDKTFDFIVGQCGATKNGANAGKSSFLYYILILLCKQMLIQALGFVRIWRWYKSYGFDWSGNNVCR
jgi:hypothetical protein